MALHSASMAAADLEMDGKFDYRKSRRRKNRYHSMKEQDLNGAAQQAEEFYPASFQNVLTSNNSANGVTANGVNASQRRVKGAIKCKACKPTSANTAGDKCWSHCPRPHSYQPVSCVCKRTDAVNGDSHLETPNEGSVNNARNRRKVERKLKRRHTTANYANSSSEVAVRQQYLKSQTNNTCTLSQARKESMRASNRQHKGPQPASQQASSSHIDISGGIANCQEMSFDPRDSTTTKSFLYNWTQPLRRKIGSIARWATFSQRQRALTQPEDWLDKTDNCELRRQRHTPRLHRRRTTHHSGTEAQQHTGNPAGANVAPGSSAAPEPNHRGAKPHLGSSVLTYRASRSRSPIVLDAKCIDVCLDNVHNEVLEAARQKRHPKRNTSVSVRTFEFGSDVSRGQPAAQRKSAREKKLLRRPSEVAANGIDLTNCLSDYRDGKVISGWKNFNQVDCDVEVPEVLLLKNGGVIRVIINPSVRKSTE